MAICTQCGEPCEKEVDKVCEDCMRAEFPDLYYNEDDNGKFETG